MNTLLIWWNFWKKGHEICYFWAIPQVGTGTQIGVVPVPLNKTKVVPVPRQSGTGTNLQNRVGTSTDQSGIGTTASYNPDFWYSYIVKLKFTHRGYRNPNK